MNEQYIIKSVKDISTNKRSEEFGYREGRECRVYNDESMLKEGYMLLVQYPNNKFFRTTRITKVETINNNLVVTTKNRIYEFEEIKGE